jgi:hypothetical protein
VSGIRFTDQWRVSLTSSLVVALALLWLIHGVLRVMTGLVNLMEHHVKVTLQSGEDAEALAKLVEGLAEQMKTLTDITVNLGLRVDGMERQLKS